MENRESLTKKLVRFSENLTNILVLTMFKIFYEKIMKKVWEKFCLIEKFLFTLQICNL